MPDPTLTPAAAPVTLSGVAASPGTGIGPAFVLIAPDLSFETLTGQDPAAERARLDAALSESRTDLHGIREGARARLGDDAAAIFDAHLLLLDDPELGAAIQETLTGGANAEAAVHGAFEAFIGMFESLDDPYLRERAADLRDLRARVLSHLLGRPLASLGELREPAIVVAHDLTPSDTAGLDP
ncbi:phosphoenolpyruvate--protein phosphotransferase, partial [Deinococcus sp. 6YEL10]|uniref:phosphoenolpyruvate-utilizing N-terminal domain-containing protein n=1 Tax=Deinococcus sp. 6YEL10 TaxID=2745870 RepID=UPI00351D57B3|nr:phosphoenolpyruvate--protein phosphotransferase [Deinococcus sp. 6YEL10]